MRLPDDKPQLLPPVSTEAMHLINALLSPKQFRLCSRKYRENEPRGKRRATRHGGPGPNAYFVFDNDASDIKRHPFFRGVNWDEIHLERPPFVPHILGDEPITIYFEDEKDILGSMDESTVTMNFDDEPFPDMPPEIAAKFISLRQSTHTADYKVREEVIA